MKPYTRLDGLVVPLDRPNVDTDAMVPKQFLKRVTRTGFGPNLFDEWRYLDHGEPDMDCAARPKNPDFVLNQARYQGAQILLARENFGCGSSREHAPWALAEYGFGAILAPSFADIFYNNCFKNGLLAVVLPAAAIQVLFEQVAATPGYRLDIDLERQEVRAPDGAVVGFEVDAFRKRCLLDGLDEIGLSMLQAEQVRAYEERVRAESPWLVS